MNGTVSSGLALSNYTAWVYIIGFDHNKERQGTGIAFQGFKATDKGTPVCLVDSGYDSVPRHTGEPWFSMNESDTNSGGWEASEMRIKIMPLIKAAFPSDLQAVIKTSTIYTDNVGGNSGSIEANVTAAQDDVYLLAEYEIFGSNSYANTYEASKQQQYAYYAAGNSKVKYKNNDTASAAFWWERSPNSGNSTGFCNVRTDGSFNLYYASVSSGVSPCFKV